MNSKIKIISPLNNLESVDTILDSGADALYFGISGVQNSRNFKGLNIAQDDLHRVIDACHKKRKKAFLVLNSFPTGLLGQIKKLIKKADRHKIDAIIVASFSVLELLRKDFPHIKIHISVMAGMSNSDSIIFLAKKYNIENVVLPSGLTFNEILNIHRDLKKNKKRINLEVVVVGTLGYGFQGKCHFARFLSGRETNVTGVCSHPKYYRMIKENSTYNLYFNKVLLGKFEKVPICFKPLLTSTGEQILQRERGCGWKDNFLVNKRYVCRGQYLVDDKIFSFQKYEYLNAIPVLNKLIKSGIVALKIEGRQRPPQYSVTVTKIIKECVIRGYKYSNGMDKEIRLFFPRMTSYTGGFDLDES